MSGALSGAKVLNGYWAARKTLSAGYRFHDFLLLRGSESLDFLNRLSTNELTNLTPASISTTVLTSEKGRIVDVATVFIPNPNCLLMILSQGSGERVKAWLEKYIIMEDILVENVTSAYSVFSFIGPDAPTTLGGYLSKEVAIGSTNVLDRDVGETRSYCYRDPFWSIPTFNFVSLTTEIHAVRELIAHGSSRESTPCSFNEIDLEVLRIEEGIPRAGSEIVESVNPLEAGLESFVSFTKGCYIGQEVIARLDTYKKLQRRLTGIVFPETNQSIVICGKLISRDTEVGWTTSHAWSPTLEKHIALGFVRTSLPPDAELLYISERGQSIAARTCTLPFIV